MPSEKTLDDLLKDGVIRMGDHPKLAIERLITGIPPLDDLLGGGIPRGKIIEPYGPESTGKTLLAQVITEIVQHSEYPDVLYLDLENSYDRSWWEESGVDVSKLMHSSPENAEQTIDVTKAVMKAMPETLGLIILDSIGAMIPAPDLNPEKGNEGTNQQPGSQAKAVTRMFHQLRPLLSESHAIFYAINQMRDNIGTNDELSALPGGRANRHYAHVLLRTRRDSWITDPQGNRIGYNMEITPRKTKVSAPKPGIILPFLFHGQLDLLTSYITDAIEKKIITRRGAYYYHSSNPTGMLGLSNLRDWFMENPDAMAKLKEDVSA